MPHHASAKKRLRQDEKRFARNHHVRKTCRNAVRSARGALETGAAEAAELCDRAEKLLRKAGSKGIYHDRTISRTVSRLRKQLSTAQR
jgi:small subunit ribosomal protein S20